ncbi:Bug family tripartite tricarboxylate transporter substrate binding protein [Hydrogenophaga sp. BPS33]|uniref:Bug family tripartite tricarboxylate transporter substrate binding protein n=1 Tax=Hydrogenophaga sp. BPS33 TaxID=2651974 RepID=UPI0013204A4E|nr:tripartite tricarboxylate transporter substrate binding protein [Hydrogenophaga sp. BPS33]QHE84662.1 tripartite tricarboxylate transporter substrate binding protein [Hydrogenophaga sp. BPS33]
MTPLKKSLPAWSTGRRTLLIGAAALATQTAWGQGASAFPNRPVRLVLPSPPGSLVDVMARLFATGMGEALQQPVVPDNKPGAGGVIAADLVAKAPADGHTLLLATDSLLTINPFIYPHLSYDPRKDFKPISLLGKASVVLVAHPSLGVKTPADLIRLAKTKPGGLNYGSGGQGHTTHLAMELFLKHTDTRMTHVAYKGTTPAMQALLGGEIGVVITGLAEALPHIKAGKVVALASSGPLGKTIFPDLPELKEINPALDMAFWFALLAPAQTPASTIATLNAAVTRAAQSPEARQRLGEFGFTVMSSPPDVVDGLIVSDLSRYGPLIKSLNIKAE